MSMDNLGIFVASMWLFGLILVIALDFTDYLDSEVEREEKEERK